MTVRSQRHRLDLLEGHVPPPDPESPWQGWCYPDGTPCTPPAEVRLPAEGAASAPWRAAVWVRDNGLVLLLSAERYELQVVELDDRWAMQREAWGYPSLSPDSAR